MKLAINPETVTVDEIDELVDNELVSEISEILDLPTSKNPALKCTLQNLYNQFLSAFYDVERSQPEHLECQALMEVYDKADALQEAILNLWGFGNTDQRLAHSLQDIRDEVTIHIENKSIWKHLITDDDNPNLFLRYLIADIQAAAIRAADQPNEDLITEDAEALDDNLVLKELLDEIQPDRHEEYKQRVKERKTPKDLPLRESVKLIKGFFDVHVDIPFTAGKYYSEIGFKSPAFYAVKMIIRKIYPSASDRKIASLMQEIGS